MYKFSAIPNAYNMNYRGVATKLVRAALGTSLQNSAYIVDELTFAKKIMRAEIAGGISHPIINQLRNCGIEVVVE